MKRKIIGVTVGSPLPKPNMMQTDPKKGDYVKGKEKFLEEFLRDFVKTVNGAEPDENGNVVVDVTEYINEALAQAKESGEFDGNDGSPGKDGSDGVGIASIKQTTTSSADGGSNVFTVTLTNGQTATFTVKNGSKGSTGQPGKDGENGQDGYSPVRGKDYWKDDDIAEIKSYVDEAVLGGAW